MVASGSSTEAATVMKSTKSATASAAPAVLETPPSPPLRRGWYRPSGPNHLHYVGNTAVNFSELIRRDGVGLELGWTLLRGGQRRSEDSLD